MNAPKVQMPRYTVIIVHYLIVTKRTLLQFWTWSWSKLSLAS